MAKIYENIPKHKIKSTLISSQRTASQNSLNRSAQFGQTFKNKYEEKECEVQDAKVPDQQHVDRNPAAGPVRSAA